MSSQPVSGSSRLSTVMPVPRQTTSRPWEGTARAVQVRELGDLLHELDAGGDETQRDEKAQRELAPRTLL